MAPLLTDVDFLTLTGLDVDQARLDILLDQASAVVRDFCGWTISPVETGVTMTVDGSGSRIQPLPTLHLTAVTSVTEDGTALVVDDDFWWSTAGYFMKSAGWTTKFRGVVAVVTHGYATTPPAVAAVTAAMVERAIPSSAVEREQTGPFSVSWRKPELTAFELDVLGRYQIPERQ